MSNAIHYQITPADPHGHLFAVQLTFAAPTKQGAQLTLPTWIPGSYLIRDFAKNLIGLKAYNLKTQSELNITALTSSRWQIEPCDELIQVHYQVYAWDLSVRSAHFDQTHGFFNGTSVFLAVEGLTEVPIDVRLHASDFALAQHWQVATGLPVKLVNEAGFGEYQAPNYRELIDYPVEMGRFHRLTFEAQGIPHQIVFTGQIDWQTINQTQLMEDLSQICQYELELFGDPYPIEQYVFMVQLTEKDYGGLEHLNSTALICAKTDLPRHNDKERTQGYLQFLELCSHEYFHTWNVKRIQPLAYQQTDWQTPAYSQQLWWFEGITSYYDALILLRAGILTPTEYLKTLAQQMTRVYRMPGRFKQSVAESSFHTWTKFYQQDENAPNAIISYYTKGSLIALALDLTLRQLSQGQKSLDDVLLHLWQHFGRHSQGLEEKQIEQICSDIAGQDLSAFFDQALYGTEDLDFASLLAPFGIEFSLRPATSIKDLGGPTEVNQTPCHLGANLTTTPHQTVKLTHIWQQQTAHLAGLSAGDEIIALAGLKVRSAEQLETQLKAYQVGDLIDCHYFRRDELHQTQLILQAPPADRVVLTAKAQGPQNGQKELTWL